MENLDNVGDENTIEVKNKKTTKRIGTFTFGLTLILFGIIVIIQTFAPFDLLRFVLMLWPIVFISIGAETLYYLWKKDIQIKYDFFGIILTLFLVFIGGLFSMGNYAVNKVLYNEQVQNSIIEATKDNYPRLSYDNQCIIANLSEKNVNVKIIENKGINNMLYINNKFISNSDKKPLFIETILALTKSNHLYVYYDNDDNLNICITNTPDYIDSIDITIYTNDKENIVTENCTLI